MAMDRRSFIKNLFKGLAVAAVAPTALLDSKTAQAATPQTTTESALAPNMLREGNVEISYYPETRKGEGALIEATDHGTIIGGRPYKYTVAFNQQSKEATINVATPVRGNLYSVYFSFDLKDGNMTRVQFGQGTPSDIERYVSFAPQSAEANEARTRTIQACRMATRILEEYKLEKQVGYWKPFQNSKGLVKNGVTAPGVMTWTDADRRNGIAIHSSFADARSKVKNGRYNMRYELESGDYDFEDLVLNFYDKWTSEMGLAHLSADQRMNALRPVFLYSLFNAADASYNGAMEKATKEGILYLPYGRVFAPGIKGWSPQQLMTYMEDGMEKLFGAMPAQQNKVGAKTSARPAATTTEKPRGKGMTL